GGLSGRTSFRHLGWCDDVDDLDLVDQRLAGPLARWHPEHRLLALAKELQRLAEPGRRMRDIECHRLIDTLCREERLTGALPPARVMHEHRVAALRPRAGIARGQL